MTTTTEKFKVRGRLIAIPLAIVSLLSIAACSTLDVNTAQAPNTNFNQYKTYAWVPSAQPNQPFMIEDGSILDQTIKATTEQNLMTKGLSPAGSQPPDLLISYTARTKMGVQYGVATTPWGWDDRAAYPVREGSITIKITDARTQKPIWQGTAADVINRAGPNQKDVANAVNKMLERYPTA